MSFRFIDEYVTNCTTTVRHIPKSCRPLFDQILSQEIKVANTNDIWGMVRLHLLTKLTLGSPPRGGKRRQFNVSATINRRLNYWHKGDIPLLWTEAVNSSNKPAKSNTSPKGKLNLRQTGVKRALIQAKEDHYGKAIRCLSSSGVADTTDLQALQDLIKCHPQAPMPHFKKDIPAPIHVDASQVLSTLNSFPRDTSPGASHLRPQHLRDAICWKPHSLFRILPSGTH